MHSTHSTASCALHSPLSTLSLLPHLVLRVGYKTWTRVCSIHQRIILGANRTVRLTIKAIASKGYEFCQNFVSELLKPFHSVLKHEILIRAEDGVVTVDGTVYCACDRETSALQLITAIQNRYPEEIKAELCEVDTHWHKCNAHKHLCLANNFTDDSRSSCIAGWVKHSARSAKSRKRQNQLKGDWFPEDGEEGQGQAEAASAASSRLTSASNSLATSPSRSSSALVSPLDGRSRSTSPLSSLINPTALSREVAHVAMSLTTLKPESPMKKYQEDYQPAAKKVRRASGAYASPLGTADFVQPVAVGGSVSDVSQKVLCKLALLFKYFEMKKYSDLSLIEAKQLGSYWDSVLDDMKRASERPLNSVDMDFSWMDILDDLITKSSDPVLTSVLAGDSEDEAASWDVKDGTTSSKLHAWGEKKQGDIIFIVNLIYHHLRATHEASSAAEVLTGHHLTSPLSLRGPPHYGSHVIRIASPYNMPHTVTKMEA
jgi:hypothetical protein